MPIDRAQIPVLIKLSETKRRDNWKKDKCATIARELQVHTKGQLFSKVDTLFPNEHPNSKAHCIATYEPITTASIWKGINDILRIFSSSSFSYSVGDDLTAWLETYEYNGNNILNHFLQEWVHRAIAEDPNGVFVVYPPDYAEENNLCPLQWVRSELIQSRGQNYFSFISEQQSEVRYTYEDTTTQREIFYDESVEAMNALSCTRTTYNRRLKVNIVKPVVHIFTTDGIIIYTKEKATFPTTIVDFAETLSSIPAFYGGGKIADRADEPLFESFVTDFIPMGNLALLAHRNFRAVDLMFTYPRMSELQVPCDRKGCVAGRVKCTKTDKFPEGWKDCNKCKGTGFSVPQSPYKIYNPKYDPNDDNKNEHLKIPPVQFFAPDSKIIEISKDLWPDHLKRAEMAIHVTQKVYTGQVQSKESKEIDLNDKYAALNVVSNTFYPNLEKFLQCMEDYISRSPVNVSVEKPFSYAILTESEAFIELNDILTSGAPVFVKANRVENFVNKFISMNSPVNRALDILKKYDPLLFYSNDEVQTFKGSNVATLDMYQKHVMAYPVLLRIYSEDKTIFEQDDAAIMKMIDKGIADLKLPAAGADAKASIINSLKTLDTLTTDTTTTNKATVKDEPADA